MATIKIEFSKDKREDGRNIIYVKVFHNNVPRRKSIAAAFDHEWDAKNLKIKARSRTDFSEANIKIKKDWSKYLAEFTRLEGSGQPWNAEDVFTKPPEKKNSDPSFFLITDQYLDYLKVKSGFTHDSWKSIFDRFKDWVVKDITISQLTVKLITDYMTFMRNKGNAESTINNNILKLRLAVGYGVRMKMYPKPEDIYSIKLSKKTIGKKTKLVKDEFRAFAEVKLKPGSGLNATQKLFLFSVYMRGSRISDTLQFRKDQFISSRLQYRMQKTKKDADIKLIPEAQAIVDEFINEGDSEYLFPILKWHHDPTKDVGTNNENKAKAIKNATAYINKNLRIIAKEAGITRPISTHSARHTFARMAFTTIGDTSVTMQLLSHSSLQEHQDYIAEVLSDDSLDSAMDSIF